MRGTVQGYPVLFTVDIGALKTIISNRVFEWLQAEDIPELVKTSRLVVPSDMSIEKKGKDTFSIGLGPVQMEIKAIMAAIDDDCLLGVDILQNGNNGPADLLMSKDVLVLNQKEVPIIQVGMTNRHRKVIAADHFVIPAESVCVVDVPFERHEYNVFSSEKDYIVEPTEHFQPENLLQMAST